MGVSLSPGNMMQQQLWTTSILSALLKSALHVVSYKLFDLVEGYVTPEVKTLDVQTMVPIRQSVTEWVSKMF